MEMAAVNTSCYGNIASKYSGNHGNVAVTIEIRKKTDLFTPFSSSLATVSFSNVWLQVFLTNQTSQS